MFSTVAETTVGTCVTYRYVGKSTDVKPIAPNGSKFEEMDTGKEYFFDGDEQGWTTKADKYLEEIKVTTAPTKVEYVDGQDFDATGMVVTAYYNNTTNAPVTTYTVEVDSPLTIASTKVTIKYVENGRTRTVEQAITVVPVALSSIAFTANPTKVAYSDGEELDLTGAEVTATYNDNSTADVTELCTFEPANGTALTTSNDAVVASYTEGEVTKTASVSITVT